MGTVESEVARFRRQVDAKGKKWPVWDEEPEPV